MAEYIELSELQNFCREYTEVDAVGLILANRTDLLHTVDVIERSKIDKAIEEINKLYDDFANCFCEYEQGKNKAIDEVLEIFKRYVGE